eukprot:CAMPEP_0119363442 /NCGR_PEP_ID=MMETSP1334-20130426/10353_1 /TAXON_ID=127549 /ORGANISM="Calcidiscus leptoporus, Strain RCC1130" /LENGTH=183 /DNA_ID=CAMNT_0007378893 /DNA_START=149 /DNA_END=700 /DNA_ORIENTATION=-
MPPSHAPPSLYKRVTGLESIGCGKPRPMHGAWSCEHSFFEAAVDVKGHIGDPHVDRHLGVLQRRAAFVQRARIGRTLVVHVHPRERVAHPRPHRDAEEREVGFAAAVKRERRPKEEDREHALLALHAGLARLVVVVVRAKVLARLVLDELQGLDGVGGQRQASGGEERSDARGEVGGERELLP